ncbi:MAG: alginate lyase family protein [Flavobacteriales bacterium]
MNITQIKLILKQPLPLILKKIRTLAIEKIIHKWWSKKYTLNDYRKPNLKNSISFQIGLANINQITYNSIDKNVQDYLIDMYSNHRFDLLGSGWIKNSYYSKAPGIEGIKFENPLENLKVDGSGEWLAEIVISSHLDYSKYIWKKIQSENDKYQPIDWQKDYKSGFRFNSKTSYLDQFKLVQTDGIDLKMPWELGRLQHLPQLAIFYKNNPNQTEIIKEFKCQLLDFIMTNPIGMGVNWSCTMDVGIRAANMCLAYDWFKQLDFNKILDQEFEQIVINYIYLHGIHTFNNFEYKEGLTSNHYLGNIAGLTYVSTYLKGSDQLDFWLGYAIQELKNELPKQFLNDGSNFEGSTAYHRLSGEMFVYCFTVIHGISEERFKSISSIPSKKYFTKAAYTQKPLTSNSLISQEIIDTFYKMAQFSLAYRKPNGDISQVGDNDSGRFFKFTPCGKFISVQQAFETYSNYMATDDYVEDVFWNENNINHDSFIAAVNGYFNDTSMLKFSEKNIIEFQFVNNLVKISMKPIGKMNAVNRATYNLKNFQFKKSITKEIRIDTKTLNLNCFTNFGFISILNDQFYFSISFGANHNSHHSWGHQHNDKLAIELQYNGEDIFIDPGTYIYTPLPDKRNLFRSTFAHNTIHIKNLEQNSLVHARGGLFNVAKNTITKILEATTTHVVIQAEYLNVTHIREILITNHTLVVNDYSNQYFEQDFNIRYFSDGYGKLNKIP